MFRGENGANAFSKVGQLEDKGQYNKRLQRIIHLLIQKKSLGPIVLQEAPRILSVGQFGRDEAGAKVLQDGLKDHFLIFKNKLDDQLWTLIPKDMAGSFRVKSYNPSDFQDKNIDLIKDRIQILEIRKDEFIINVHLKGGKLSPQANAEQVKALIAAILQKKPNVFIAMLGDFNYNLYFKHAEYGATSFIAPKNMHICQPGQFGRHPTDGMLIF